jgi:branched-chain amino acid transport system ATP-binding protein
MADPLLVVDRVTRRFGGLLAVNAASLAAQESRITALIGPNGAGKTTLLRTMIGMLRPTQGRISYHGRICTGLRAFETARLGMVYVPAEKELFPGMTVRENLELGAYRNVGGTSERLGYAFALFPRLAERRQQLAGTLSGGEQQMLAIGRALMGRPKVLLLDEPSTGLAPKMVAELYRQLANLKADGLTMIVTEQQVPLALSLTDRAYVLEQGAIRLSGKSLDLVGNPEIKAAYLGVT